MSQFHNPYHFVPVPEGTLPTGIQLERSGPSRRLPSTESHLDHGRYLAMETCDGAIQGPFSGRIVCRLDVLELLALGGRQTPGDKSRNRPREVELFEIDGKPAIAGSSLRGLLSSIAEAASGGAMRVLGDQPLSLSAGPRNRKEFGTLFDYFKAAGQGELLPLQFGDGRATLSLGEALFGVVEMSPESGRAPSDWNALALGSRLRISHGLPEGLVSRAKPRLTQILDSPKLPAPAFYFKDRENPRAFVPKLSLAPGKHVPQGRKFYLHRRKLVDGDWISAGRDQQHQKAEVAPVSSGRFWFHVDFFNLTRMELELLSYALRPSEAFRHKLGMGKSLGLGKVEIRPMGLFLIDRRHRYATAGLRDERYALVHRREDGVPWPDRYAVEREAATSASPPESPEALAGAWRHRVERDFPPLTAALRALEQIGDPGGISHPVHYPQIGLSEPGTAAFEKAHFKWFMENERSGHEGLAPLPATPFPGLSRERARHHRGSSQGNRTTIRPGAGADWRGPVEVVCRRGNRGDWTFRGSDHGENVFGFLDRAAALPAGLREGLRLTMEYKRSRDGRTCFFRPV